MQISLVCAAYPPDLDGIGDYSCSLAKALAGSSEIKRPINVYTRIGLKSTAIEEVRIVSVLDSSNPRNTFEKLPEILASQAIDGSTRGGGRIPWIVLQYNPFSFGKRGFCPWVPRTLSRIRKSQKTRVAIMFHETCVPKWPWRFSIMYLWQQPILRYLCRVAEIGFVSTERWIPEVRRGNSKLPCRLLPVGSNVPMCNLSRDEARLSLKIPLGSLVLGVFGSAHASRRVDWIAAAARAVSERISDTVILYVGPDGAVVRSLCEGLKVTDAGVQPAEKVGVYLRAMDLFLSPFSDGVSSRRTSIVSPLQHGVPVVTTLSGWSDAIFRGVTEDVLILSNVDRCEDYVDKVVAWLAARNWKPSDSSLAVTAFHQRHFTWDRIADVMVGELKVPESA